jgi:hypothetical protein
VAEADHLQEVADGLEHRNQESGVRGQESDCLRLPFAVGNHRDDTNGNHDRQYQEATDQTDDQELRLANAKYCQHDRSLLSPAFHQIMFDAELIQHAGHDEIDLVHEARHTVVPARHGGQDDCPAWATRCMFSS